MVLPTHWSHKPTESVGISICFTVYCHLQLHSFPSQGHKPTKPLGIPRFFYFVVSSQQQSQKSKKLSDSHICNKCNLITVLQQQKEMLIAVCLKHN